MRRRGRGRSPLRFLAWALLLLALVVMLVQLWFLGRVVYWKHYNPASSSFMLARLDALRDKDPGARLAHQWVGYARISSHLKRAVVSAEDARFIDHEGFDWEGIQRALDKNQKKGRVVSGGSTITQQLAKNLFLSGDRSYLRKGQEALIAAMLEAVMDKRRILEIYLNVVEWGENVFGAEAAARHYFGVSAAQLGPGESARLAAMLPRPRHYQSNPDSRYLGQYTARILARMNSAQVP